MKRLKTIYTLLLLAVALPLITACTNDDAAEDNTRKGEKVTVRLRLSQAAPAMTRAVWEDENATDDEMMNIWTVVAVKHETDQVVGIWTCKPQGDNQEEIDDISEIKAEFEANTSYRFYSFANMGASYLNKLLFPNANIITNPTIDNQIVEITTNLDNLALTEDKMNEITVKVEGNGFNKFTSAEDNGFDSYGIPMSNVQTFESLKDGDRKDLIVVRMLAKIELWLYNDKSTDLNIKSITLTDITANTNNVNNNEIKLFPHYTKGGANEKVNYALGDIQPYEDWNPRRVSIILKPGNDNDNTVLLTEFDPSDPQTPSAPSNSQTTSWTILKDSYENGNGTPVVISFYVNESATPTHDFKHFFLEMEIDGDKYVGEKQARYVMIDDNGTQTGEKWNYIARNDYRIIPIVLDDYKLDMIPYDFPAIGVYPASMKEEDGIYTITFHDYGHFHLQPKVTKYSNGDIVPYDAKGKITGDHWALYDKSFNSAWGTWTDATKEQTYSGDFYRTSVTGSVDGDDAGGLPVWYENTSSTPSDPSTPSNPQWASDWAPNSETGLGYQPFIFGYIADPKGKPEPDKKVYHEFSINLYKQGTGAARQMTYRLYMILNQDQMMYPDTEEDPNGSRRALGAPAARHTHGH